MATSDQSVLIEFLASLCQVLCFFFFFCIVFPLFGNEEPPLAKSVESSFQNESTPPITFVPDPVNKVMESAIENESRPAIITSLADSGSLLKKKIG